MRGGQSQYQERERPAVLRPEHGVECTEVREGVREDHQDIQLTQARKPHGADDGQRGVEKKEERGKNHRALEFVWTIKLRVPAPEIELAEQKGNGSKPAPVAAQFDEQNDLRVLALTNENRCEKTAKEREQGNALRIAA